MSSFARVACLLAASFLLAAETQAAGGRGFGGAPGYPPPPNVGRRPYPPPYPGPVPVPVPVPVPDSADYYGGGPSAPPPPPAPRREGESINGQWYY